MQVKTKEKMGNLTLTQTSEYTNKQGENFIICKDHELCVELTLFCCSFMSVHFDAL